MPHDTDIPKWIFWSSRDSIDNDVPSVTAIIETIIAVPLYWWIAIQFETYLLLLTSAIVAPFVLLRSDASTKRGVQWFSEWKLAWEHERTYNTLDLKGRLRFWAIYLIGLSAAAVSAYFLARYFLVGRVAWLALLVGVLIVWLAVGVGVAIVFAAAPAAIQNANKKLLAGAMAVVMAVSVSLAGAEIWGTVGAALGGAAGSWAVISAATRVENTRLGTIVSSGPSLVVGVAVGIYTISLIVRIGSTLQYLPAGFRSLPQNFRRLILCTSPLQVPELIPGLPQGETKLTLFEFWDEFRSLWKDADRDYSERIFVLMLFIPTMTLWFLPGWLYRLTLKSTAWFWWPLAFLGGDLRQAKHPELFRQNVMETLLAKASLALSALTILGFLISNIFLSEAVAQSNPFLTVLGFLFLIDWLSIGIWKILAVVAAAISVLILFWTDKASREYHYAIDTKDSKLQKTAARKFGWIERVARFRLLVILAFWVIVAGHALIFFNSSRCWFDLSENVLRQAQKIYGDRLPTGKCISHPREGLVRGLSFVERNHVAAL